MKLLIHMAFGGLVGKVEKRGGGETDLELAILVWLIIRRGDFFIFIFTRVARLCNVN